MITRCQGQSGPLPVDGSLICAHYDPGVVMDADHAKECGHQAVQVEELHLATLALQIGRPVQYAASRREINPYQVGARHDQPLCTLAFGFHAGQGLRGIAQHLARQLRYRSLGRFDTHVQGRCLREARAIGSGVQATAVGVSRARVGIRRTDLCELATHILPGGGDTSKVTQ